MKEIINLMKLDLITVKNKSLIWFLLIYIAMSVVGFIVCPILPLIMVVFSGFSIQPAFTIAEQSGYNKLYGVLPVKRSNIVIARFALTAVIMLGSTVLSIFLCEFLYKFCLCQNFEGEWRTFYDLLYSLIKDGFSITLMASLLFCFGSVFTVIEFTLIYIFGTSKEIPAFFATAFIFYGLLAILSIVFGLNMQAVIKFFGDIWSNHIEVLYIALYGIGIIFTVLASLITNIFMKRKEL